MSYVVRKNPKGKIPRANTATGKGFLPFVIREHEVDNFRRDKDGCYTLINIATRRVKHVGGGCPAGTNLGGGRRRKRKARR